MNQIVSLFMFSCGDYEKIKQDVWEENWKAMRLYSVVALVVFGVITLVSVFSLSIGKYKWVYLVYTFLSLVCFCISRCQLIAIQQIIANSRRNGTSLHSPAE